MRLTDNEFHTKENKERACYIQEPRLQAIYDKLFDLEDIEEELGIDLVTLFKALKNGIWVKYDADFGFTGKPKIVIKKDKCTEICLREKKWWIQENDFLLKDYGKTWALTRKELLWHTNKVIYSLKAQE